MRKKRKRRQVDSMLDRRNGKAQTGGPKIRSLDAGPSRQEMMAIKRNQNRIDEANKCNRATLLSKYLPSSTKLFLHPPVEGPEEFFRPLPEFHTHLKEVADATVTVPKAPLVEFVTDWTSLEKNPMMLECHSFNLDALSTKNKGTTLNYGSKFCPLYQLKKILGDHPHFPELSKILTQGMDY
jgi:hypothetical protein